MKLALSILLLATMTGYSANHYVREGAAGTASGDNWTDAYTALPASLTRGDTYYIADGTYASYTVDDAQSGTSVITIKKASASDHGTETGWNSTYGDGQAVFNSSFNITRPWIVFDGSYRNESNYWDGDSYGFKIQTVANNQTLMNMANGSTPCTNITVKFVFILAPIGILTSRPYAIDTETGDNAVMNANYVFHKVYVKGSNNPFFIRQTKDALIEYCAAELTSGSDTYHGEMVNAFYHYFGGPTVRYSHFRDAYNGASGYNPGGGTGVIAIADNPYCYIYGNIFERFYVGDGAIAAGWPNDNVRVFNNTFIDGVAGSGALVRSTIDEGHVGNMAYNNLAVGCANSTYNGLGVDAYNSTAANTIFVNYAAGNYRLASATTAGTNVAFFDAAYAIDPDGVSRTVDGVWDRGAFEFDEGPNDTSVVTGNIGISGNVTIQ